MKLAPIRYYEEFAEAEFEDAHCRWCESAVEADEPSYVMDLPDAPVVYHRTCWRMRFEEGQLSDGFNRAHARLLAMMQELVQFSGGYVPLNTTIARMRMQPLRPVISYRTKR